MNISEIVILLLIYSVLFIFFVVPSSKIEQIKLDKEQLTFSSVFKATLAKLLIQKKALFALALLGFALYTVWSSYTGEEWHYNDHSGYSPISYHLPALLTIGGVVVYSVVLFLTIGYVRTIKKIKNTKYQA